MAQGSGPAAVPGVNRRLRLLKKRAAASGAQLAEIRIKTGRRNKGLGRDSVAGKENILPGRGER